jgi:hypothetical protein
MFNQEVVDLSFFAIICGGYVTGISGSLLA